MLESAAAETVAEVGATDEQASGPRPIDSRPSVAPPEKPKPRVSSGALARAEEALEWRFRCADHDVMFFGAQSYESGGATTVFDDRASWALHERMGDGNHTYAVAKMRAIDHCLAHGGPQLFGRLRLMYAPPFVPELLGRAFSVAETSQRPSCTVTLVGLLPVCPIALTAYDRCYPNSDPPGPRELIRWVDDAVRPSMKKGRAINRIPEWAKRARDWLEDQRVDLLTQYVIVQRWVNRAKSTQAATALRQVRTVLG